MAVAISLFCSGRRFCYAGPRPGQAGNLRKKTFSGCLMSRLEDEVAEEIINELETRQNCKQTAFHFSKFHILSLIMHA